MTAVNDYQSGSGQLHLYFVSRVAATSVDTFNCRVCIANCSNDNRSKQNIGPFVFPTFMNGADGQRRTAVPALPYMYRVTEIMHECESDNHVRSLFDCQ